MEERLWRAFVAVIDHGTYAEAARVLAVSQPTVTKQIQSLERQAGGELVTRGWHGAQPTALGRALLPDVREALERLDALRLRTRRLASDRARSLTLAFGLSTIDFAPRAVAEFRRRHPSARVALDDMASAEQVERLRRGELDAGFMRLPVEEDLSVLELGDDRLVLAIPAGVDPAPGVGALITELGLVSLVPSRSPGFNAQIEGYLAAAGLAPRILQRANDIRTVLALVAAGMGTALVSARAGAIAPDLRLVPVDHPAAGWRIGLVWAAREPSPALAAFVEVARALADGLRQVTGRPTRAPAPS